MKMTVGGGLGKCIELGKEYTSIHSITKFYLFLTCNI